MIQRGIGKFLGLRGDCGFSGFRGYDLKWGRAKIQGLRSQSKLWYILGKRCETFGYRITLRFKHNIIFIFIFKLFDCYSNSRHNPCLYTFFTGKP